MYPAIPFWSAEFLLKDQLLSVWGFPCMLLASPLLLLILFLCVYSLLVWLVCVLACFSMGLSCMGLFVPLGLDYFLFHVGEIFNSNLFKMFSHTFFFFYSPGVPIIRMLVCMILSQRSLRLFSVLFILFTLFCSSEFISTILSSSSLICSSASYIQLLIPSRVFLT